MGGGNDVGFSDILKYCAGFNLLDFTCDYSEEGTDLYNTLNDSIASQYFTNKN